jgi:hypothetical protein
MKKLDTLVEDIYSVVEDSGGWSKIIHSDYMDKVEKVMSSRLGSSDSSKERKPTLRMSNIGKDCQRQLWYDLNPLDSDLVATFPSHLKIRFLMGDMTEELLLSLAEAAGHTVTGRQDTMTAFGITGHRDAVIDGVNVDVKSTSASNFNKFKDDKLISDDPHGYMRQLSSYVYASKDDPLVTDKEGGAFLAMNINTGELVLDYHNFTHELKEMELVYNNTKAMVKQKEPPPRPYELKEQGKTGGLALPKPCYFCQHKYRCEPTTKTYDYGNYQVHLVKEGKIKLKGKVIN